MMHLRESLKRNWRTFWTILAQAVDTAIIGICLVLTSIAYDGSTPLATLLSSNLRFAILIVVLFVGINTARGLYRKISYLSFRRQIFHASRSYLYTTATVFSIYFLTRNTFYIREFVLIFFVLFAPLYLLTWLWLVTLRERMGKYGFGRWNTLLIGPKKELQALEGRINVHPELGYDVRSVLTIPRSASARGLLHVDANRVKAACDQHDVDLIVFSSGYLNGSFDPLEDYCARRGTTMRMVSAESDYLFSRARLQDFAGIPLFWPARRKMDRMSSIVKRAFDIAGALLGLLILSPLFAVVALFTRLESKGPIFFKQKRSLSDHDTPFEFYKFRSMHHAADEQKYDLADMNETSGALFKIKNDPRLTRVGRIIRRHSIDELPQLINVLKGEMSLVGPRPLPVHDYKHVTGHDHMGGYFRQRARAKPGMTGLWQISGRSDLGFREMVLLDLYYIENKSILFDIEILLQTIPVVIFGKGGY